MKKQALKVAFRDTIPVLTGYLFLGAGFGILLSEKGYGIGWAFFMSLFMYAGSGQYLAVSLLASSLKGLLVHDHGQLDLALLFLFYAGQFHFCVLLRDTYLFLYYFYKNQFYRMRTGRKDSASAEISR